MSGLLLQSWWLSLSIGKLLIFVSCYFGGSVYQLWEFPSGNFRVTYSYNHASSNKDTLPFSLPISMTLISLVVLLL